MNKILLKDTGHEPMNATRQRNSQKAKWCNTVKSETQQDKTEEDRGIGIKRQREMQRKRERDHRNGSRKMEH